MWSFFAVCLYISVDFSFGLFPRECHMTPAYPPPQENKLMEFEISLDENATTRWNEPILYFKDDIIKTINLISNEIKELTKFVDLEVDKYLAQFPRDYGDEIVGIASTLNMSAGDVFLANIAYELVGFCTSIVVQDTDGHIYHGRNLDAGMKWNFTEQQWDLTDDLKKILFAVNITQNGQLLYRSVVFGGYIGVLTAMKKDVISISVNSRFDKNYDKYLIEYLTEPEKNKNMVWSILMTRLAMETQNSYNDTINFLKKQPFISPCYLIIGGVQKGDGAVLTFGPNNTFYDRWDISNGLPNNNTIQKPFYILETNYDHWEPPPFFDDRRYPAEMCLDEIGSKGMNWYTLYNVLNGLPSRNRMTSYTALIDTKNGDLVAYKQYCDIPECKPW